MKPWEVILQRACTASGLNSSEWEQIAASVRERAFFSAEVTSTKILEEMKANVVAMLKDGKSASEIRRDLRTMLFGEGYQPDEEWEGTIKDLRTKARLDIVIKTNTDQAKGYARLVRDTRAGAILAFPAYRFVRRQNRKAQRDWATRWANAAKAVNYEGVAKNGEMIALKTSPIWETLSRFGTPYLPFDYNSGMGLQDVKKSYCREIGLLGEDEQPKVPKLPDFNESLKGELT